MAISTHRFPAPDGVELAWHELGEGRPVVLLHGLFSNADMNWIRFGHAAAIAGRGFRVIMPDLRAHGQSDKPHDPGCYPKDILARDGLALIERLELSDYDLGGYSLGARTAIRMMVNQAKPKRLVIAGMGLSGLTTTGPRSAHFRRILNGLGSFEPGTNEWMAEAFLKTTDGDPDALLPLLDAAVDTSEAEIAGISQESLVVTGADDHDNGSAEELAKLLPNARYVTLSGNHMSVVTKPSFGQTIAEFLGSA
jgi:pimeloyl-ACP methyl ester carboxylesterase